MLGEHHDSRLKKARDFREAFHWGHPAKNIVTRKVSPPPEVAVKLGELYSVTYKTNKKGEPVQLFEHEFEKQKPWLAMDVENKRLHILGGGYTVTADGITG